MLGLHVVTWQRLLPEYVRHLAASQQVVQTSVFWHILSDRVYKADATLPSYLSDIMGYTRFRSPIFVAIHIYDSVDQ
jgi:hypothetical protein